MGDEVRAARMQEQRLDSGGWIDSESWTGSDGAGASVGMGFQLGDRAGGDAITQAGEEGIPRSTS